MILKFISFLYLGVSRKKVHIENTIHKTILISNLMGIYMTIIILFPVYLFYDKVIIMQCRGVIGSPLFIVFFMIFL